MTKKKTPETTEDPKDVVDDTPKTDPPAQPDTDWEGRYKGLQRTFDRTKKELDDLREKQEDLLEESETSKQTERDTKALLEKLQKDMDDKQAEFDSLTGELATHKAKGERADLIMSDFSDLASFEARGLLPQAETVEEMKEKFEAFRDALKDTVQAGVQEKVTGAGPASTGGGQTPTRSKEQIYARLQQLAGTRDAKERQEYDALLAEWDSAVSEETQ